MLLEILLVLLLISLCLVLYKYLLLYGEFASQVAKRLEEWKAREIEKVKVELDANLRKEYELRLREWMLEKEKEIREDAIRRSASVVLGKVGEHLAPILVFERLGINPKDVRYLGTPIDFLAFKGLSEGKLERIYFIEVKSGRKLTLSAKERQIREAIKQRKVDWLLLDLRKEIEELGERLRRK